MKVVTVYTLEGEKQKKKDTYNFFIQQNQLIVCQHFSLKAYIYSCYTTFEHDK
jgi:hypothetical protein